MGAEPQPQHSQVPWHPLLQQLVALQFSPSTTLFNFTSSGTEMFHRAPALPKSKSEDLRVDGWPEKFLTDAHACSCRSACVFHLFDDMMMMK